MIGPQAPSAGGRRRGAWIIATCVAACHPESAIRAPDTSGAEAAVLVVVDDDSEAAYAIPLQAGPPTWPELALRGDTQMQLSLYACPLERLGLSAGPVTLDRRADRTNLLPQALRTLSHTDQDQGWAPAGEAPERVQQTLRFLPIAADTGCTQRTARLQSTPVRLGGDDRGAPAFAISLPDSTALIASRNGQYYRVDRDATVTPLNAPITAEPRAAHSLDDGTVYILDAQGTLHRGILGSSFEPVHTAPQLAVDRGTATMVGPTTQGSTTELFVATSQRSLHHFNGTDWTTTATAPPAAAQLTYAPPLIWLGPGRVMATGYGSEGRGLAVHAAGQTELILPPRSNAPVGLGVGAGPGVLVGFDDGVVQRYFEGSWELIVTPGLRKRAHFIRTLHDHTLLLGGGTSVDPADFAFGFGQWSAALGFCAPAATQDLPIMFADLGAQAWVLLTADNPQDDLPFNLTILREASPAPVCGPPNEL